MRVGVTRDGACGGAAWPTCSGSGVACEWHTRGARHVGAHGARAGTTHLASGQGSTDGHPRGSPQPRPHTTLVMARHRIAGAYAAVGECDAACLAFDDFIHHRPVSRSFVEPRCRVVGRTPDHKRRTGEHKLLSVALLFFTDRQSIVCLPVQNSHELCA